MEHLAVNKRSPVPLYQQIYNGMAESIRTDKLFSGMKLPSELQLSKRFGVSPMTVRKAMDQLAMDQLILRKQGSGTFVCKPSNPASMTTGGTGGISGGGGLNCKTQTKIGVVITDYGPDASSFWSQIIQGLEEGARHIGCQIGLHLTQGRGLVNNQMLTQLAKQGMLDALIGSGPLTQADITTLRSLNLPVLLMDCDDHRNADLPRILLDDASAVYEMTRQLLQQGHRRIGLLSGQTSDPDGGITRRSDRLIQGYQQAFGQSEFSFHVDDVCQVPHEAKNWIRPQVQHWLETVPEMTAIIANGDVTAWEAFDQLHSLSRIHPPGANPGEGVVLANYADAPRACGAMQIKPLGQLGWQAIETAIKLIEQPQHVKHLVVLKSRSADALASDFATTQWTNLEHHKA